MVIRECVWVFCAYISCTGDEGQLGSSFLWNIRLCILPTVHYVQLKHAADSCIDKAVFEL